MIFVIAVFAVFVGSICLDTFAFVAPRFDGQEDARRQAHFRDHYRGLRRLTYSRAYNRAVRQNAARAALILERHPKHAS